MATIGGELAKIEGEMEKPGPRWILRMKHATARREHARWAELSVLAWTRERRKGKEKNGSNEGETRWLLLLGAERRLYVARKKEMAAIEGAVEPSVCGRERVRERERTNERKREKGEGIGERGERKKM